MPFQGEMDVKRLISILGVPNLLLGRTSFSGMLKVVLNEPLFRDQPYATMGRLEFLLSADLHSHRLQIHSPTVSFLRMCRHFPSLVCMQGPSTPTQRAWLVFPPPPVCVACVSFHQRQRWRVGCPNDMRYNRLHAFFPDSVFSTEGF